MGGDTITVSTYFINAPPRALLIGFTGVLALLIPSPLSDLEGYRPARSALSASHAVCEPLLELGQDAFASVTQPCFALVARPRRERQQCQEHQDGSSRRAATHVSRSVVVSRHILMTRKLPT